MLPLTSADCVHNHLEHSNAVEMMARSGYSRRKQCVLCNLSICCCWHEQAHRGLAMFGCRTCRIGFPHAIGSLGLPAAEIKREFWRACSNGLTCQRLPSSNCKSPTKSGKIRFDFGIAGLRFIAKVASITVVTVPGNPPPYQTNRFLSFSASCVGFDCSAARVWHIRCSCSG